MNDFWRGTAADWGTSIGTIALAVVSFGYGRSEARERKLLQKERDDARREAARELAQRHAEEAEVRRRARAEFVSCDLGVAQPAELDEWECTEGFGPWPYIRSKPHNAVTIRNGGDKPITKITVMYQDVDAPHPTVDRQFYEFQPPYSNRYVLVPLGLQHGQFDRNRFRIGVEFIDFDGLRWVKYNTGVLDERGPG